MKTKCFSVRLESLLQISAKCFKATSFDGRSDFIPASQVFGQDYEVNKSEAYWISEWILKQKDIQYSEKKVGWFNSETRCIEPNITIEKHIPEKITATQIEPDSNLIR